MPGDPEELPAWVEQIRDFIGVERAPAALDTVLATVLFTDIVGSTERSSELGIDSGRIFSSDITRSCATH